MLARNWSPPAHDPLVVVLDEEDSGTIHMPPNHATSSHSPAADNQRSAGAALCGLNTMRQQIRAVGLPQEIICFITSSIKHSSIKA